MLVTCSRRGTGNHYAIYIRKHNVEVAEYFVYKAVQAVHGIRKPKDVLSTQQMNASQQSSTRSREQQEY